MSTDQHHPSTKIYFLVFACLAVLTGLTVFLSYAGLPHKTAIAIASLIAATKITLIGSVFMHLRSEGKGIQILWLAGLFFVAVLVLALIPDIGLGR